MSTPADFLPEGVKTRARSVFRTLPSSLQGQILQRLDRHPPWENGRPPVAPAVPAGQTTGPPDFVGIGVPKCGTTWWFSLIMAHPDVHVEHLKELLYFNRWFIRHLNAEGCTQEELDSYHDWFPRPTGKLTGEWSPNYVFQYQLAPLMKRTAPQAKMIVMLRDPVERFQSDISRHMNRQRQRMTQYRSVGNGFYASILEPWEDLYDSSELLVLQFEACLLQPEQMLTRTFEFLGLDSGFRPDALRSPVNKTAAKVDIEPGMRRLLVQMYEREVAALVARHPDIDLRLWPNFAGMLSRPASASGGLRSSPDT